LILVLYNGYLYAGVFLIMQVVFRQKWVWRVGMGRSGAGIGNGYNYGSEHLCRVFHSDLLLSGLGFNILADRLIVLLNGLEGNYVDSCSTVGINEISLAENLFSLSPNPATQTINIIFSNPINGKSNFEIFNVLGEKMFEHPVTIGSRQFLVDVSNFRQGIYCCELLTDKSLSVAKFIKQ